MSLDSLMMTPTSDFLPRARPMGDEDSPEARRAFIVGILDEVLDILNDDMFEDDHDTESDRGLPQ